MNNPVIKLSQGFEGVGFGTTKSSVRSSNSHEYIQVHIRMTGIMATCQQGSCEAMQRHKKSLCGSLETMLTNKEVWGEYDQKKMCKNKEFGLKMLTQQKLNINVQTYKLETGCYI